MRRYKHLKYAVPAVIHMPVRHDYEAKTDLPSLSSIVVSGNFICLVASLSFLKPYVTRQVTTRTIASAAMMLTRVAS